MAPRVNQSSDKIDAASCTQLIRTELSVLDCSEGYGRSIDPTRELYARTILQVGAECVFSDGVVRVTDSLLVFIFVMTGIVYEAQHRTNPEIGNFADALYFTVTALTTTGFGDITLEGTGGKLVSIVTMLVGISLFVRLAQALFRPHKVFFPCPRCALQKHDPDAVHCKACGHILKIPDEG